MHISVEKQIEEDLKIKQRKESSAIWRFLYKLDDIVGDNANKSVKGKEKRVAIVALFFTFMDSVTTHIFLHYNLGIEGNLIPARFFDAGLTWEFEVMKWLAVSFIIAFNYVMATRGWTRKERAGGRAGLYTSFVLFVGVVFWNITMMVITLLFK